MGKDSVALPLEEQQQQNTHNTYKINKQIKSFIIWWSRWRRRSRGGNKSKTKQNKLIGFTILLILIRNFNKKQWEWGEIWRNSFSNFIFQPFENEMGIQLKTLCVDPSGLRKCKMVKRMWNEWIVAINHFISSLTIEESTHTLEVWDYLWIREEMLDFELISFRVRKATKRKPLRFLLYHFDPFISIRR